MTVSSKDEKKNCVIWLSFNFIVFKHEAMFFFFYQANVKQIKLVERV